MLKQIRLPKPDKLMAALENSPVLCAYGLYRSGSTLPHRLPVGPSTCLCPHLSHTGLVFKSPVGARACVRARVRACARACVRARLCVQETH